MAQGRDLFASWKAGLARLTVTVVVSMSMLASGCGERQPTRREVVPTFGRLSFDGAPAAGAMVFLHPADDAGKKADWSAGYPRATIGPEGDFHMTTYETQDGAPPGKYVMVVTWSGLTLANQADEAETRGDREAGEDRLDGRFADPATSKIQLNVAGPRADLGHIQLQR
jgi:hypothetical protein